MNLIWKKMIGMWKQVATLLFVVFTLCQAQRFAPDKKQLSCLAGWKKTNPFSVAHGSYRNAMCHFCGQSCCNAGSQQYEKRIYNGVDAKEGEFPWSVALFVSDYKRGAWKYKCGGVLVSDDLVLTAAHCVSGHSEAEIRVTVGEVNIDLDADGYRRRGEGLTIKQINIDKRYVSSNIKTRNRLITGGFRYDYAELKLSTKLPNSPYICIRGKGKSYLPNHSCYAIGHGNKKLDDGSVGPSSILQKSTINLDVNNNCLDPYQSFGDLLCASKKQQTVNCMLDSGSPVVCRVEPKNPCSSYYLAGLFSTHEDAKDCKGSFSVLTNLLTTQNDPIVTGLLQKLNIQFPLTCTKSVQEW